MGQWTRVENNNEVFLRVTNHGYFWNWFELSEIDWNPSRGQVDFSLLVRYGSSLGETPHYYSPPEFIVP